MTRTWLLSLCVAAAAGAPACTQPSKVVRYRPLTLHATTLSSDALFMAVRRSVRAGELQLVDAEPASGTIEARSAETLVDGVRTRETWRFSVSEGAVRVTRRFEAMFEPGVWTGSDLVCDSYSYLREHLQLALIEKNLRREEARP